MRLGENALSGERFDELAKDLAAKTTSRRSFLTGLVGATAAALLHPARGASQIPPGGSDCANQGQSCTAQQCCQGLSCVDDLTSGTGKFCCLQNLVCGSRCCPAGGICSPPGQCACPPTLPKLCPGGPTPQVGQCINPTNDVNNCGECGVVCPQPTGPDAPCRVRACVNGSCTTLPKVEANGLPCETGNLCTADVCDNGVCKKGPVDVICPDEQCQTCNPSTGICEPIANGTPCNDGNPCTLNDTCQAGICTPGALKDCDDNNECTTDFCDPATGLCVHQPVLNGLPCETGNLCTGDFCENGTCKQGPVNVTCPDEQCQKCNPTTGGCEPIANGTPCDDGNKCTVNDTCQAGLCTPGLPLACDDGNECTEDSCDPATGCVHTPLTGTPCETGNKCTTDTCDNGVCKQGPQTVTCPQCQVCDTGTGTCKAVANGTPCEDGDLCTTGDTCQNGTCQPGAVKTCPNTGNPCTVSVCNKSTGICEVQNRPNGTGCSDGNVCTTGDSCQNGVCVGTAVVCTAPQICCPSGMHAGTCKLPGGATCTANGQCCSNSCAGPAGNRKCAA